MPTVVIDASYALACVMPDEARPKSMKGVLDSELIAPYTWPLEIANAMRSGVRRGRFERSEAAALCSHIEGLGVTFVGPVRNDPLRHFELSVAYGLTPYDALYLDLALAQRAGIATHDTELRAAAERLSVPVLC